MKELIMHTTHCPKCETLKSLLSKNGILFKENTDVNIMHDKGINSVPILEHNGELYTYVQSVKLIREGKLDEYKC